MFDPGALGTLVIGLRATGQEYKFDDGSPSPDKPSRGSQRLQQLRCSTAAALRRLADRLEPRSLDPGMLKPGAAC